MPSRPLNRRRFLGCSAAAGLALAQGAAAGSAGAPVDVGLVGLGNRGTTLLRAALASGRARVVAVCDAEPRHVGRALGILEKAGAARPVVCSQPMQLLERSDLEAALVALPCDLHGEVYAQALQAGKHLYAEKPLGVDVEGCDRVIAAAAAAPDRVVHVGLQRRVNPRYVRGVERIAEIGELLTARASWLSGNGPILGHGGWLGSRARSGDWMIEQAVHVWDLLCWIQGSPPAEAYGHGRRHAFRPDRDVTDFYTVTLSWPDGFTATLVHSWCMPVDDQSRGMELHVLGSAGFLDLTGGSHVVRDRTPQREILPAGPVPDTDLAVRAFLDAARDPGSAPTTLATLADARRATQVGLLVRKAVDERRLIRWDELFG
jgi:predicted dehydrogenase